VSNLFLTQNLTQSGSLISVLWSLPYEIQMYAILPLLFMWALHFPSLSATAGAWSMAVAVAAAEYILRARNTSPDFLIARYFPCFLAGVFAWRLIQVRRPSLPGRAWVVFLLALVVVYRVVGFLRPHGMGAFGSRHCFNILSDWLFCAAAGLAVPFFLQVHNACLKSISKQIARYSYGIYVSHCPALWLCLVRFRTGSAIVSAALAVLLTALVAVLLYHCLEDPGIRLGKRLASGIRAVSPLNTQI
jgi:peptidoglycan/LPS O-acetylase OafA/YrhL